MALPVCQKLLEAASSVVHVCDVPLEVLLHFLSAFPQEFTDYNGEHKIHTGRDIYIHLCFAFVTYVLCAISLTLSSRFLHDSRSLMCKPKRMVFRVYEETQ